MTPTEADIEEIINHLKSFGLEGQANKVRYLYTRYQRVKAENLARRTQPMPAINISINTNNPNDGWTMNIPEQATFEPVVTNGGPQNVNE